MIKNKIAISYIRCSTKKQVHGFSIDHQISNINKYAIKNGYNVSKRYIDSGISGKHLTNRPQICNLINDIKNGMLIDALFVESLDRLARNLNDLVYITNICFNHGIKVISILNPIDSYSIAEQKFLINLYGLIAENKVLSTKESVENALSIKLKKGKLLSKQLPFALKMDNNGKLHAKKYELKVLRKIYELCLQGYGYRKISIYVSKNYNIDMSIQQIKSILKNQRYTGVMKTKYGTNNSIFPKLISDDMYQKVQQKIASSYKTRKNDFSKDMFYKKINCPICHHKLGITITNHKNVNYSYYYCSVGRNGLRTLHHNFSLSQKEFKSLIMCYLKNASCNKVFGNKLVLLIKNFLLTMSKNDSATVASRKRIVIARFKSHNISTKEMSEELKRINLDNNKCIKSMKLNLTDISLNRFIQLLFKDCYINNSKNEMTFVMKNNSVILRNVVNDEK